MRHTLRCAELRIAQDDAADELLRRDPLALVIGLRLDQHVTRDRRGGGRSRVLTSVVRAPGRPTAGAADRPGRALLLVPLVLLVGKRLERGHVFATFPQAVAHAARHVAAETGHQAAQPDQQVLVGIPTADRPPTVSTSAAERR